MSVAGALGADAAARWAALRRDPLLVAAVTAAGAMHAELLHTRGRCGAWCYEDLLRMVRRRETPPPPPPPPHIIF